MRQVIIIIIFIIINLNIGQQQSVDLKKKVAKIEDAVKRSKCLWRWESLNLLWCFRLL